MEEDALRFLTATVRTVDAAGNAREVIARVNLVISQEVYGNRYMYALSALGPDSVARGVTAAAGSGRRLDVFVGEKKFCCHGAVGGSYHLNNLALADGVCQSVVSTASPGVVIAWDGDLPAAVRRRLLEETDLPLASEWGEGLVAVLGTAGLLKELDVWSGPGAPPVRAAQLNLEGIDEAITSAVADGRLAIPEGPEAPPLDGEMNLEGYIATYGPVLGRKVVEGFDPRHVPGWDPEDPLLGKLLRRPFPAQGDVIQGLSKALNGGERGVICCAEMGSGKTLIAASACYVASRGEPFRALIMCPGHLVEKWAREIEKTVPDVLAVIVRTTADLMDLEPKLKGQEPKVPEFYIISRDRAKLGYRLKAGVVPVQKRVRFWDDGAREYFWDTVTYLQCPRCGNTRKRDGKIGPGYLAATGVPWTEKEVATRKDRNSKCPDCGEVLWYANKDGVRRYPPAEYIKRRLKGVFDYFVADEVHELKGATAQGNVLGMLAATCGKTIALTGTLLGGYASDLFRIAFRLAPKALRAEGLTYNSMEQWVERYGVLERRITEEDGEWNSSSRGRKREAKPIERPGVSPLVFGRFLLPRTAFLELSDVAANLPPYEERVVLAGMSRSDDPQEVTQEKAYRGLERTLRALVQETGQAGKSPFLGAFLHGTLAYPDKPFGNEPVVDPRDGKVVFTPAELPDDILYPKEEELARLVKRELATGRRCFIYTVYTDRRDVASRLAEVLRREGVKGVEVLRASVAPERREAWLADAVKRGAKVVVGNPNLVKTGLDLLDFPTMIFYATGYSVYTLRQAARRSWRIGQKAPVRVYFLGYRDTMQESALRFMGSKVEAAMGIEGRFSLEGLQAMMGGGGANDLARAVLKGLKGIDSAEAIWGRMYQQSEALVEEEIKREAADLEKPAGVPWQVFFLEQRIGGQKGAVLVEGQGAFGFLQDLVG